MDYHEPWSVEFGEYVGYDGMSGGYKVRDATGRLLFVVDSGDFMLDEPSKPNSPSAAAQAVADRIVACVNAGVDMAQDKVVAESMWAILAREGRKL